ncbi:MAG: rhodanese-like domain-containing protein [Bacteroidaceae bacterium]|nr:rhodanese-like domain-containing protein [Bacteroidaceae bacterium]
MKAMICLCLCLGLGMLWACSRKATYQSVDVEEFAVVMQQEGVVLLDVRTAAEFAEGHLAGATLLDVQDSSFLNLAQEALPANANVAVYCRSGRRSAAAAEKLAALGYKVVNLKGGILAWQAAGKETER